MIPLSDWLFVGTVFLWVLPGLFVIGLSLSRADL